MLLCNLYYWTFPVCSQLVMSQIIESHQNRNPKPIDRSSHFISQIVFKVNCSIMFIVTKIGHYVHLCHFYFFWYNLQFQVLIFCLETKITYDFQQSQKRPFFPPKLSSTLLYLIWVDFQFQPIKTLMKKVSFVQRSKIHSLTALNLFKMSTGCWSWKEVAFDKNRVSNITYLWKKKKY